jgi:hypothetical protein
MTDPLSIFIILGVIACGLIYFNRTKKGGATDDEHTPDVDDENDEVDAEQRFAHESTMASASNTTSTASTKTKRRLASKKGFRTNRLEHDWDDDIVDDLYAMTFPGYYHPRNALFMHAWAIDNDYDEDDYEIELNDGDGFGFEGAVLTAVSYVDGWKVMSFLDEHGEEVARVSIQGEQLIIGDQRFAVEDSGAVMVIDGDNHANWSEESGVQIDSALSEETLTADSDDGDIILGAQAEETFAVNEDQDFLADEPVESTDFTNEVVNNESTPEPEDIPEATDNSQDGTAY